MNGFNKELKNRITKLLENNTHLRNNDNQLIANIFLADLKNMGHDINSMTGYSVLKNIADSNLTHTETIRRLRAKIQEENEHLRGVAYKERHKKQTKVKRELGYTETILQPTPERTIPQWALDLRIKKQQAEAQK